MQSHYEVEGQYVVMSSGQVVRPSSVDGFVEWSDEWPVDTAPDVEEMTIREEVEEFRHPV